MKIHFIDDDHSTNRYHEITLTAEANALNSTVEYFDKPLTLLESYDKINDLPNILFIDINMPVIDGWKFLDLYNEKFATADTKCIILTTSNNPKIIEQSKMYPNVKQVAIKPLTPDNFRKLLTDYTD